MISFMGLSSKKKQEYTVALLSVVSAEVDEGKWAITAAGGIPLLMQLLLTGSAKVKEDAALLLQNFCCHSTDIYACVQSVEVVPAPLHLLKDSSITGQVIA